MGWLLWLLLALFAVAVLIWFSLPLIAWFLRGIAIRYGMRKGEKIVKRWWSRKEPGDD